MAQSSNNRVGRHKPPTPTRQAREGDAVQRSLYAAWAAAGLALGCAGTQTPSPNPAGGATAQLGNAAAAQQALAPKTSWSDRLLAPVAWMKPAPGSAQRKAQAKAKADADKIQKQDPLALDNKAEPTAEFFVAMADMSCRGGNVPHARSLFQRALALEPKNLNGLLGAARMEDRDGRLDVAVALYERAAAAYPNNPTVFNDLGLCLARQGRLPEAERALVRAVQLEPAKSLYRNNVAKVLVELNRLDEAAAHLAAVNPPAAVHYNMGVLLWQRGRNAEAEQYLFAALAADPQLEAARVLMAQLQPPAPVYQTARAPRGAGANGAETDMSPNRPEARGVEPAAAESTAAPSSLAPSTPTLLPPVN
jgi:Tfp pilus assembly protein PilF